MRGPRGDLDQHRLPVADRQATAGEQELGHRLKVDRVSLDRAPAHHLALLGHMPGVQLQDLPPVRPRRRGQQRLVVVASGLNTDPDLRLVRQQTSDPGSHLAQR